MCSINYDLLINALHLEECLSGQWTELIFYNPSPYCQDIIIKCVKNFLASVEVFYKAELFKALFVSQQIQFVRSITITQGCL